MSGNNFILSSYLDNTDICDTLINYFETEATVVDGLVGNKILDKSLKSCQECYIPQHDPVLAEYHRLLQRVCEKYINEYVFSSYSLWSVTDDIKIQKYYPGDAYYSWHYERFGLDEPMCSRHLVFMTYLNDVTDEGETEFFYQKIKVQPRKGLTLIWPSEWTHTHRGLASPTQTKYIVTGWYNFLKEPINT